MGPCLILVLILCLGVLDHGVTHVIMGPCLILVLILCLGVLDHGVTHVIMGPCLILVLILCLGVLDHGVTHVIMGPCLILVLILCLGVLDHGVTHVIMGPCLILVLILCLGVLDHGVTHVINPKYDTIIVGLGSAGTTAASTLAKAGKRVLALEAQDRVGGRVHTVPFGDGIVEVGAEWIHGIEHSRTYETAINNSITILPQDFDIKVYKSDGTLGDTELMDDLMSFCINLMEIAPEKPEPLGMYITRKFREYVAEKYPNLLNDTEYIEEFLDIADIVVDAHEGSSSWNDVTSNSNYKLLVGNQEMSWHRYGYKTFFELLLNTYNNGPGWPTLDIKLNKEVTLIKWPQNITGSVEVTCKDGDVYTADNIIVTVSLGVLKERYQTLFSPPLPESKVTAINKMSMGVVGKIILSFTERWWPEHISYVFQWLKADKEKYDKWQIKLKDLSSPKGSNNTLTFWTIGETTKLVETLPEEEVKKKCMAVMRMFIGKNITIPDATGMIRSMWYTNPFTRGTYSFDNLLLTEHPGARAALGAPLQDLAGSPRVLFAGEATDLTHFSTVHGASDSGFREAMRILTGSKV